MRVIALFRIVDNRLRKSVSGEPFPQEKPRNATTEFVDSREHPDRNGPVDVGVAADVLRMRTRVARPWVITSTLDSYYCTVLQVVPSS